MNYRVIVTLPILALKMFHKIPATCWHDVSVLCLFRHHDVLLCSCSAWISPLTSIIMSIGLLSGVYDTFHMGDLFRVLDRINHTEVSWYSFYSKPERAPTLYTITNRSFSDCVFFCLSALSVSVSIYLSVSRSLLSLGVFLPLFLSLPPSLFPSPSFLDNPYRACT